MAFVDKYEVVAEERLGRYGLFPGIFTKLRNLYDLDRMPDKKRAAFFLENVRIDTGPLEFAQVLLRKPLIWGEQNNMSDIAPSVMFFEVKEILQDIGVHNERLAAARRHPKAYFV